MRHDMYVRESDVRAMVRLLGEVAASDGDISVKQRLLMERIAELIDADKWMWSVNAETPRDDMGSGFHALHGGFTAQEMTTICKATFDTERPMPCFNAFKECMSESQPITRARWQWISDKKWYESDHVQTYRKGLTDDYIYGLHPTGSPSTWSVIAFHRVWGRPRFSEREVRIVHIISTEVDWLHSAVIPEHTDDVLPTLSPRQRTVLLMLMEAHGKKQIAYHLGLSVHTVNDYIKAIYKHFDVSSRAELMRRFMVGDGGDGLSTVS